MEEAFELTLELGRDPVDHERAAEEAADLERSVTELRSALVELGR
jgi:hypothetical protein